MLGVGVVFLLCYDVNAAIEGQGIWLFDEGTGQIIGDSSLNHNDGYPGESRADTNKDANWDSSGRFGSCISVDGTIPTYITVPDNPGLNIAGKALTMEAWVNPGADLAPGEGPIDHMHIMSKDSYRMAWNKHNGTISALILIGGVAPELSSPVNWKTGEWHHVAATYDGTEAKLYIDGSLKNAKVVIGNIDDSTGDNLCIGVNYNGQWGWIGKIDEVRVLNRALTASEIADDARYSLKDRREAKPNGDPAPIIRKEKGDISITEIDIPFLPFFESVSIQTMFINPTPENDKVTLEVSLEKDGKIIRTFPRKEIICLMEEEKTEKHTFDVKDIKPGRYTLLASLLKDGKVVDEEKKLVRIYGPFIPVSERDFNYVLQHGTHVLSPDFQKAANVGETEIFRLGWGPVRLTSPPMGWAAAGTPLGKYAEYQMPFIICEGLVNPWEIQDEPYEWAKARLRKIIKEAEGTCGEYFHGVWLGELSDGIIGRSHEISTGPPMNISHPVIHKQMIVPGEETRLGKANAYIKVIKHIKEDLMGLSPGKVFMTGNYYVSNQALEAEAGANVIIKESGVLGSFTQQMSLTRGVARSFRKRYGDVISAEPLTGEGHFKMSPPAVFKWDIKTGRYDAQSKRKLEPPVKWTWSLEDDYKIFIERYYNGVNYLISSNEHPFQSGKMVFNFLDFVDKNPRSKNIVSSVSILESKGNYIGSLQPLTAEEVARKNNSFEVYGLWKWLYPDNIPYKEEMDFLYLNSFFPKLTDDNVLYKHWWTGTTYGAVDRIYPAIKLEDMKKYNAMVFMGFHRMDSVRKDFLNDLMKYVKDGGIIVLAADQMKNSNEEFIPSELKSFMGVSIAPGTKLKIKDYVKVVETTPFNIKEGKYPIASEVKFKGEKEPWVYKAVPEGANVVAVDSEDTPVLLLNKYGNGYIFLFTSPTLSMIPPVGKSPFVSDIIDKVCKYKPLPVILSPDNEDVEFLIAKTEDKEATVFIMNHGERAWEGDIIIDLARSGLSPEVGEKVSAKVCQGYKVKEINPEVVKEGDKLIIRGIRVEGDTSEPADYNYLPWWSPYEEQLQLKTFCSYRQASFALVRLEKEK